MAGGAALKDLVRSGNLLNKRAMCVCLISCCNYCYLKTLLGCNYCFDPANDVATCEMCRASKT